MLFFLLFFVAKIWLEKEDVHLNVRIEVKKSNQILNDNTEFEYLTIDWCSAEFYWNGTNVKVINTKNIREQTAMALKVSQTKLYWASQRKHRKLWYQFKKNTIYLLLEMLGIHFERYKTLISSFLWILFSSTAKNEVWSSNHMHLFTSMSLSNYEKPQIKGVQEGKGRKGAWTKTFCKAISLFNVLSDFWEWMSTFFVNVHCWL